MDTWSTMSTSKGLPCHSATHSASHSMRTMANKMWSLPHRARGSQEPYTATGNKPERVSAKLREAS